MQGGTRIPHSIRPLAAAIALLSVCGANPAAGDESATRAALAGSAILDTSAYELLAEMSDRYGPRMIGTEGHHRSLRLLEETLAGIGIASERQDFDFPGWVRGESDVRLVAPFERRLRAAALGYVTASHGVEAEAAYVDRRSLEELDPGQINGRILVVAPHISFSPEWLKALAQEHGVHGALFINRVDGGQLLARVASPHGEPAPIPLFTITQEEGFWLQRLIERGESPRVRLGTTSRIEPMAGANLIVRFPGRSGERILLGAHFDSWDLGQGAMDNGLGVAQLFAVARVLRQHSPENLHTVELVWFDAEEFGLWGSRHYVGAAGTQHIRAMINLDMVGRPAAVNAMGFDGMIPILESYNESLGTMRLDQGVISRPWVGSDHMPFMLSGIPSITFNAPIDPDSVRYYHDLADTMDKIDPAMLGNASALIALLVHHLANDPRDPPPHLDSEGAAQLFRDAGLEERMRRTGTWPFGDPE